MPDTPAVRRADLIGSKIGRFVVLAHLGQGGMGEVFKARDTKLNRIVALKRLHIPDHQSGARSRLLAEAERASRVNHPNIATVYDVIEERDDVLLVMEFVEGQTLRHRLEKSMPVEEAVRIATQCAEALSAAHKQGVIHCDIKPENVMLTAEGGVKLLDFGIARVVSTPDSATVASRTHSTAFSGTPAYMSPEVLNEQQPDGRSDIFSLGVVLYEMLAGENPFQSAIMIETANQVLHRDPPPVGKLRPEVPEQVDRIVSHAIEKAPPERYESATLMANDLRSMMAGEAHLVAAPVHRRKRRLLDYIAPPIVGVVVLALAVGLWLLLRNPSPAVPQTRLVAVLPFSVNSDDRSAQAFSDGLVETLSAKLSRISDGQSLQVIPAWEVRSQKVTTAEEAVKTLGVNLVVEGSLRQVDKNVRVTYALVDPSTHRQLHGDSLTATMSDPFAVEDKVVDSVLLSLKVELQPGQRQALNAGRPAEPGAYDFYLQGRGYLQDFHKPENVDSAITVFQRALQIDPKFGLAYAGLGEAYWRKWYFDRSQELVQKSLDACGQSVKLSPSAVNGHLCLGLVYNGTGKYEDAAKEFQQAINQDPTSDEAYSYLGGALERLNRMSEAEHAIGKSIALHPNYWHGYSQLGAFYYRHGRFNEAIDALKKEVELAPDNFHGYSNMAGVYLATGDYKNAAAAYERSIAIRPTGEAYSNAASAYFFQHRYSDSIAKLREAQKMLPNRFDIALNLAESWRWIGDAAEAKTAAERAVTLGEEAVKTDPRDATSASELAYSYALLRDKPKALLAAGKAIKLGSPTPGADLLLFAALTYRECGDDRTAAVYAEKARRAGIPVSQLRDHPAFASFRNDPNWRAVFNTN